MKLDWGIVTDEAKEEIGATTEKARENQKPIPKVSVSVHDRLSKPIPDPQTPIHLRFAVEIVDVEDILGIVIFELRKIG